MVRLLLGAAAALIFVAGAARAEEIKATLTSVDAGKHSIVVSIDGNDKTFLVAKDAEVYTQGRGRPNKPAPHDPFPGGLGALKAGSQVTLTTIRSGERDIVSAIKFEGMARKKNK